jgi:hypothetical protein
MTMVSPSATAERPRPEAECRRPTDPDRRVCRHSVNVLLRVYAKCVYGQDEVAKARIEAALALGAPVDEPDVAATSRRIPREQP